MKNPGISVGGESRLRKALEAEVQREYAQELSSAKGFFERLKVKEKIRSEIKKRMGQSTSPHALYSSLRG
jgi:hypothetical protein